MPSPNPSSIVLRNRSIVLRNRSIAGAALVLSFCLRTCRGASNGPGSRRSTCCAAYNNTLYVWGGLVPAGYPNFTSTNLPLSTTDTIVWTDLSWDIPILLADNMTYIDIDPCVVSPNGILVVGGMNLFGFDLNAKVYVPFNLSSPSNTLGSRHNVRKVHVKDSIYYFGGYAGLDLNLTTSPPYPELFILNLTTWSWKLDSVANTQTIPPNYGGSALTYADNGFIYMIGGSLFTSNSSYYFSNIYKYNIETRTWAAVTPSSSTWTYGFDNPALVTYNGAIYVLHGGSNMVASGQPGVGGIVVNLTYAFDIQLNVGYQLQQDINNSQYSYAPPESMFNTPAVFGDAVVFISAVGDGGSTSVSGVWIYNFTIHDWTNKVAAGPYLPSLIGLSNSTSPSSTPSSTPSSSPSSNSAELPKIALIAGLIVVAIAVIAALAFLVRRYRKHNHQYGNVFLSKDSVIHKPNAVANSKPDYAIA